MSDSKKQNLFAKLAGQQPRPVPEEPAAEVVEPPAASNPPPALPVEAKPKSSAPKKKPEPVKGKRDNPDYCQANAYVPKALRRAVDKALFDVEGLDYSTLVEDLLRKWLKSRGVSE
jgi:hypothetical protein